MCVTFRKHCSLFSTNYKNGRGVGEVVGGKDSLVLATVSLEPELMVQDGLNVSFCVFFRLVLLLTLLIVIVVISSETSLSIRYMPATHQISPFIYEGSEAS